MKVARRNKKVPVERLDSMKRLFDDMKVDEDLSGEICESCEYSEHSDDETAECRVVTRQTSLIVPRRARLEDFSRAMGPYLCYLSDSITGMGWQPAGRFALAVHGPASGLHYWELTGTRNGKSGYVFGLSTRRGWKYATVHGNNRIQFQSNSKSPDHIDIEVEPIADGRVFHMHGGYLIPGTRPYHYVRIGATAGRGRRIEISDNQRLAHTWILQAL